VTVSLPGSFTEMFLKKALIFAMNRFFAAGLLFFSTAGLAQPPRAVTLEEALALGLQNRVDLKNKRLDLQLVENTLAKARDQWLPKVDLSNDFRFNTQLQQTVLPSGFQIPGQPTGGDGQRVPFGTRFNNLAAANLDQRLYSPTTRGDVAVERKNLELESERLRQTETEARLAIAEAYFNAQLQRETARLDQRREVRARELLAVAEGRFALNNIQQDELDRACVDLQTAAVQTRKSARAYDLARQNLGRSLLLPDFQAAEPADSLGLDAVAVGDSSAVADYVLNRSEVRQQRLQAELTTLQDDRARLAALPTVSLYGNYTFQYQSNDLNLLRGTAWSPFNYLGLRATLPLFDRYDTRHTRREYALRRQQALNTLQNQQREVLYELQQAQAALTDAAQNLESVRANLQLAEQVYRTGQDRYRLGNLLYADLLQSQRSLHDAEGSYLAGLYDYLVAKVRWERAKGEPAR